MLNTTMPLVSTACCEDASTFSIWWFCVSEIGRIGNQSSVALSCFYRCRSCAICSAAKLHLRLGVGRPTRNIRIFVEAWLCWHLCAKPYLGVVALSSRQVSCVWIRLLIEYPFWLLGCSSIFNRNERTESLAVWSSIKLNAHKLCYIETCVLHPQPCDVAVIICARPCSGMEHYEVVLV